MVKSKIADNTSLFSRVIDTIFSDGILNSDLT